LLPASTRYIEDTDTSPTELETEFGSKICHIVEEVTDDKRLSKEVRKQLQIEHAGESSWEARQVKLADKICNVHDLIDAPPTDWSLHAGWFMLIGPNMSFRIARY
jgi:guanosine-3',5'-bis(diphosphate) 3'-pyrophosphohydrolase